LAQSIHRRTSVETTRLHEQSTHALAEPALAASLRQLYRDLFSVIERDPEQEILGIALPVVDSTIARARTSLTTSDHGLAPHIVELISADTCSDGRPIRALDAWLVVGQLLAAFELEVAR
jgi:hypothetical protein